MYLENITRIEPTLTMGGRKKDKVKEYLMSNLLVILLFLAICMGIGLGAAMREIELDEREQMYFA